MSHLNNFIDTSVDFFEKVSTPTSRAGSVVERIGKMREEGVDAAVVALQMTKNSPNSQKYSTKDIESYSKLYKDSRTKAIITSKQARALIEDQRKAIINSGNLVPQS